MLVTGILPTSLSAMN